MRMLRLLVLYALFGIIACARLPPEMPERELDYIQVSAGGSIMGPAANRMWRVYTTDEIFLFEKGWQENYLASTTIDGAYLQAQGMVNGDDGTPLVNLAAGDFGRNCSMTVSDFGRYMIDIRLSGELTQHVNYCPAEDSDAATAFFAIYMPLLRMLDIDPR